MGSIVVRAADALRVEGLARRFGHCQGLELNRRPVDDQLWRARTLKGRKPSSHSQLDPIARSVHHVLLGPEISLCRLHRSVSQKQLDLLKLSTSGGGHIFAQRR